MRTISRGAIIAIALFLSHPTAADAQLLKGLKRVTVVAQMLPGNVAGSCAATNAQMDTSAAFIISQSQLQIVREESAQGRVDIFVFLFYDKQRDLCWGYVNVKLSTRVYGTSQYGRVDGLFLDTYDAYQPLSREPATMPKYVTDTVESMIKDFVVKWKMDNP